MPQGGPTELSPQVACYPSRFGHHPSLDGFRGIAALVVVCYHTDQVPHFLGAGQAAMEMFFVLSGFLITSVLRRSTPRRAGSGSRPSIGAGSDASPRRSFSMW